MKETKIAGIALLAPLLLGNGDGEIDAIRNTNGKYSITDISQYSDGKTYTIEISHHKSITRLIFERPNNWSVQSQSKKTPIDEHAARAALISWLNNNFTCGELSRIDHTANTQKEYFGGAIVDILNYDKNSCSTHPNN